MKNKPEMTFRAGLISVAIWKNETNGNGKPPRTFRTVSFERRYKDKDGEWQSTSQLGRDDLPRAINVLTKAYDYLVTLPPDVDRDEDTHVNKNVSGRDRWDERDNREYR